MTIYLEPSWSECPGAVYLIGCEKTGIFKIGASISPDIRVVAARVYTKRVYNLAMRFVWSISTNAIGRLENAWMKRWKPMRMEMGRELFALTEAEVRLFTGISAIWYNDLPRPTGFDLERTKRPYYPKSPAWRSSGWVRADRPANAS